jgi:2-polyprenyl-3-methyl-5-hydroxy-6-metoxy-1,4-benzoquinol methylase
MTDARDLAVVIPTRDRWAILGRTLAALRMQTVQGFEIVVVVDGTDQTPPPLDGVSLVVVPHGGPAAARNAGVKSTTRRLVLFLGDDMIPDPTLVAEHLAVHARGDATTAVLGRVEWHPDVAADRVARWLDWSATQFDYASIQGEVAGFGHFYSCNVSLPRSLFMAVDGFDESFGYYYEDLDAGRRLADAGMQLRYAPAAVARHLHRYDLPAIQRRFAGIATGERTMADKHPWFQPYFRDRVVGALVEPPVPGAWARMADLPLPSPLRRRVRKRANRWWYQQVGDSFLDRWEGERGLAELRDYLGDAYDERRLREHMHEVEREEAEAPDEATFYRTSESYLYDLTVFAMSGTKSPYLRDLRRQVPPGSRLLDYGCGIGSDGLRLIELGYQVSFADFANPSTAFLRWRLDRREKVAEVFDVDGEVPTGFDAVYCWDVIEHIDDPFAFLANLEQRAAVVAVNFLEPAEHDVHVHKPLPVKELLDHVNRHQVLSYRRYYERSHVVVYRTTP